uniref:hypothetical protein n=1 Tax=Methylobacterium sp. TaxID=409 RepID=UPI0020C8E043|nr:hypothetical protein [Methylobacterium sp.]USU34560.1 hypothetical protein NG677_23525 [Methylobacterium sp.]
MPLSIEAKKQFFARNVLYRGTPVSGIDSLIFSVGFESRSRYIFEQCDLDPNSVLALSYESGRILAFDENLELARSSKIRFVGERFVDIEKETTALIADVRKRHGVLRVGVDVSAMNRSVMAAFLSCLYQHMKPGDRITTLYTPARFRQPDIPLLPLVSVGPAHPCVSGSIVEPGKSRNLIMGLGYEYGISLSIIDRHEPDLAFIFKPIGFDEQYIVEVRDANFNFDFGDRNYEVIDYRLSDPARLFDDLSSLINGSLSVADTVIVPLGPKLFSAISIIVGMIFAPNVPVLRYSMKPANSVVDVESDGIVSGCEFECLDIKLLDNIIRRD